MQEPCKYMVLLHATVITKIFSVQDSSDSSETTHGRQRVQCSKIKTVQESLYGSQRYSMCNLPLSASTDYAVSLELYKKFWFGGAQRRNTRQGPCVYQARLVKPYRPAANQQ